MEESTNPPQVPSNCTSPVCSDPAHDDLALHAEWSDEDGDSVGDGPLRVEPEDRDDQDDRSDPDDVEDLEEEDERCLLYTSPSPRDGLLSRMPSSA